MKLTIVPPQGFDEYIEHAHAIHQDAQVAPWKLSTFADCFTKPYYGVFAFENEKVIGYAIMLEVVDEATLMDIAVDKDARGKGGGRALVDFVIETSMENNMREIWLEVRESNHTAIALYEGSGFEHIETRKNYYTVKSTDDGNNNSNVNSAQKENAKIMKWTTPTLQSTPVS